MVSSRITTKKIKNVMKKFKSIKILNQKKFISKKRNKRGTEEHRRHKINRKTK